VPERKYQQIASHLVCKIQKGEPPASFGVSSGENGNPLPLTVTVTVCPAGRNRFLIDGGQVPTSDCLPAT
jgi:hypothetical protein